MNKPKSLELRLFCRVHPGKSSWPSCHKIYVFGKIHITQSSAELASCYLETQGAEGDTGGNLKLF